MIRIADVQGTGRAIELRKLVIKLGSAVVTRDDGELDGPALAAVADGVTRLRAAGVQVIVVSSGAIAVGRRQCPAFQPRTIPDRQALAAVGQVGLMHIYKSLFNERGFLAAQVLLTRGDMENRQRYLNARYTLERLLALGTVPVINENDTVTVDELKFGDNDELSALVVTKMEADLLVILSTIDGLHAGDPRRGGGEPLAVVEKIDATVLALADRSRTATGTGGMTTKLEAMRIASAAGVHGIIASGKRHDILERIVEGRFRGTYFAPAAERRLGGRQRWIAFGRRPRGELVVDAGAREALVVGKKSLLAAGVTKVRGEFEKGDLVEIVGPNGAVVARGLVNYSSADAERIRGCKTGQIRKILGSVEYPEVVHRDNLAMQTQ